MTSSKLKLTLKKSVIGCTQSQRACVIGLGLRKTNSQSVVPDTPENRGMINKIRFLLRIQTES